MEGAIHSTNQRVMYALNRAGTYISSFLMLLRISRGVLAAKGDVSHTGLALELTKGCWQRLPGGDLSMGDYGQRISPMAM